MTADLFIYAIDADAVKPGRAAPVQIGDRWFVVCNDRGQFYAGDNLCPHAGGSLGKGDVHDGCIVCPVHHWPWDLKTGLSDPNMPFMRMKRYHCEVREEKVYVNVSAPIQP
jgi:nitrite reductase/ring-hydroxylating ferredoxin subunit